MQKVIPGEQDIFLMAYFIITVTSKGARWCLQSPALRLFTQPFVQENVKEIKAPRHWPL